MKINVFPIASTLHNEALISFETLQLIKKLKGESAVDINIVDIDDLYNADLSLILIQSGGSEGKFLSLIDKLQEPYYLLTYGTNNSLAASMEILSYLKSKNLRAEILHGKDKYIASRLGVLSKKENNKEVIKLGVIGKPSDWLIASYVDYQKANKYGLEIIDISLDELINEYNKTDYNDFKTNYKLNYDVESLKKAQRISLSIEAIIKRYNLKGVTVRCFDLLSKIETTSCLALSLLNAENIIGTCEGDVPSMISMYILNKITGQPGFQANPSSIDVESKTAIFSHCTLPLNMANSYKLTSHFESGIGVAIKGELKEQEITIFKLSNDLSNYYVSKGKILRNLNETNLCRTQIKISIEDDISYFLKKPYGNHHIIVYGDYVKQINEYMANK